MSTNAPGNQEDPKLLVAEAAELMAQGDLSEIDRVIVLLRRALAAPGGNPDLRAGWLSNLGAALQTRFVQRQQPSDLDEAVSVLRAAVAHPSPLAADRAGACGNLGNALFTAFRVTGDVAVLDESVGWAERAADTIELGHSDRVLYLSNLALGLQTLGHTGCPGGSRPGRGHHPRRPSRHARR